MSINDDVFQSPEEVYEVQTRARGPEGRLPLTEEMLRERPSGDVFGLSQNAGMGWKPAEAGRKQFLILSTQGGMRAADGQPIALGYHTGHWEIGLLVQAAAEEFRGCGTIPFAGFCSDPCDGRTQGTTGMFDSLPYRNDAAVMFRRLARSLPLARRRAGHRHLRQGPARDDDGGGGVGRSAVRGRPRRRHAAAGGGRGRRHGADAGARVLPTGWFRWRRPPSWAAAPAPRPAAAASFWARRRPRRWWARRWGCRLPHSALAPSGQAVWLDMARRSARALVGWTSAELDHAGHPDGGKHRKRDGAARGVRRLDQSAAAHPRHRPRRRPESRRRWRIGLRSTGACRGWSACCPTARCDHPTVRVFLAGRRAGSDAALAPVGSAANGRADRHGTTLGENLDWWESSDAAGVSANCCARSTASSRTT